jgi:hypothetical protein
VRADHPSSSGCGGARRSTLCAELSLRTGSSARGAKRLAGSLDGFHRQACKRPRHNSQREHDRIGIPNALAERSGAERRARNRVRSELDNGPAIFSRSGRLNGPGSPDHPPGWNLRSISRSGSTRSVRPIPGGLGDHPEDLAFPFFSLLFEASRLNGATRNTVSLTGANDSAVTVAGSMSTVDDTGRLSHD